MSLHISIEDAGLAGFCSVVPKTPDTMVLLPCGALAGDTQWISILKVWLSDTDKIDVGYLWLQVPMQMSKTFDESMLIKIYIGCFCYWVTTFLLHSTLFPSVNSLYSVKTGLLDFSSICTDFPRIEPHKCLPLGWLFLFVTSSPIYPRKHRPNISLPPAFLMEEKIN